MSLERSIVRTFEKYTFPTGSFWLKSLGLPQIRWLSLASLNSLENMRKTTRALEVGHTLGLTGIGLLSISLAQQGETVSALATTGLNIIGNVPAILLNRCTRARLNKAILRRRALVLKSNEDGRKDLWYSGRVSGEN